jgi:hypothetical protein
VLLVCYCRRRSAISMNASSAACCAECTMLGTNTTGCVQHRGWTSCQALRGVCLGPQLSSRPFSDSGSGQLVASPARILALSKPLLHNHCHNTVIAQPRSTGVVAYVWHVWQTPPHTYGQPFFTHPLEDCSCFPPPKQCLCTLKKVCQAGTP